MATVAPHTLSRIAPGSAERAVTWPIPLHHGGMSHAVAITLSSLLSVLPTGSHSSDFLTTKAACLGLFSAQRCNTRCVFAELGLGKRGQCVDCSTIEITGLTVFPVPAYTIILTIKYVSGMIGTPCRD